MSEKSHRRKLQPSTLAESLLIGITVYVKGRHLGYQRGKRNTNPNVSLLALEGVDTTQEAQYEAPILTRDVHLVGILAYN